VGHAQFSMSRANFSVAAHQTLPPLNSREFGLLPNAPMSGRFGYILNTTEVDSPFLREKFTILVSSSMLCI
jgi:hypothetical protein